MTESGFFLHPQLATDTIFVTDLPLSRVQLMNDKRFPWLILIPRRPGVREFFGLDSADRFQMMEEMSGVAAALEKATGAEKMNVAALGNSVPQLHVHVVARFSTDPAWPKPVWGYRKPKPYGVAFEDARDTYLRAIRDMAGTA